MDNLNEMVSDVLHNVNWMLESHNSSVELISIQGNKVIIHCEGHCSECETNCVRVAFRERLPQVELVFQ